MIEFSEKRATPGEYLRRVHRKYRAVTLSAAGGEVRPLPLKAYAREMAAQDQDKHLRGCALEWLAN